MTSRGAAESASPQRCHAARSSASLFLSQQGQITFRVAQDILNLECNGAGAREVWNWICQHGYLRSCFNKTGTCGAHQAARVLLGAKRDQANIDRGTAERARKVTTNELYNQLRPNEFNILAMYRHQSLFPTIRKGTLLDYLFILVLTKRIGTTLRRSIVYSIWILFHLYIPADKH